MDRPETLALLRMAHDEIIGLRREVEDLRPKAHAYDTIAIITRLSQNEKTQSYGVDAAWQIKEAIQFLVAEREAEKEAIKQEAIIYLANTVEIRHKALIRS